MILLAVAVLLIGWAVFSLGGNSEDTASSSNSSQVATASEGAAQGGDANGGNAGNGGTEGGNNGGEGAGDGQAAEKPEGQSDEGASGESAKPSESSAQGSNGSNAGGEAKFDRAETRVTVLNNSPVTGLAGSTADRLAESEWNRPNVGNLPDDARVFETSVVLYPANDASSRAAAEDIARDLNIRAVARNSKIDDALRGAELQEEGEVAKVVVVTTSDMQ